MYTVFGVCLVYLTPNQLMAQLLAAAFNQVGHSAAQHSTAARARWFQFRSVLPRLAAVWGNAIDITPRLVMHVGGTERLPSLPLPPSRSSGHSSSEYRWTVEFECTIWLHHMLHAQRLHFYAYQMLYHSLQITIAAGVPSSCMPAMLPPPQL